MVSIRNIFSDNDDFVKLDRWCGTTAEYCESDSDAPTPSVIEAAAPLSPTYSLDAGQCGNGNQGEGLCSSSEHCCSNWVSLNIFLNRDEFLSLNQEFLTHVSRHLIFHCRDTVAKVCMIIFSYTAFQNLVQS